MIDSVFAFLQNRLERALPRDAQGDPQAALFAFVGSEKDDAVAFKADTVSMLLIRIEEDTTLRTPDRYARMAAEGGRLRVEPEIRINLWLLFAARFADYGVGLRQLARVVAYFQHHRVFNATNSPELGSGLGQLVVELVTPSFAEQNEIWGSLRAAYLPSALYRVRLLVFSDPEPAVPVPTLEVVQSVVQSPVQMPPR